MTDLDNLRAQVALLRWARERKAEAAEVEASARAAVEDALGDDETGTLDGQTVVTWKRQKRRALNQKALRAALPQVVEQYMDTSEIRVFKVMDTE